MSEDIIDFKHEKRKRSGEMGPEHLLKILEDKKEDIHAIALVVQFKNGEVGTMWTDMHPEKLSLFTHILSATFRDEYINRLESN